MAQAEKIQDGHTLAKPGAANLPPRSVPADWFVDPADPQAAERYQALSLEDQATAFLDAHESLLAGDAQGLAEEPVPAQPVALHPVPPAAPSRVAPEPADQAVWLGIPGFDNGADDDGELAWQADALCAQTDPEAFFPEKGGSTRDAKKVCAACTVRSECLEYALANDERFGIWGGLSERERRRLRKRAV